MKDTYQLLDSGNGRKLERFGPYVLDRPSLSAVWQPELPEAKWRAADAQFTREGQNNWRGQERLAKSWVIGVNGVKFKLEPTDFGHLGIFPEQKPFWHWIEKKVRDAGRPIELLNLFAYSGGVTLAAAKGGASVCHLDASKGMVAWARENASLNGLEKAKIRWIIDDVIKFLTREVKRGHFYDAIVLDPPTFGRGAKGEVFKIENDLLLILNMCKQLLSKNPLFMLLSCHTPGLTPTALEHLLGQTLHGYRGELDSGEMLLEGEKEVLTLPSGAYARWTAKT